MIVVPIAGTGFEYSSRSKSDKRRHQDGATPSEMLEDFGTLVTVIDQPNEPWRGPSDQGKVSFGNQ